MTVVPHAEPFDRFRELFDQACAQDPKVQPEPTACALASVDTAGHPSVRMVLLKAFDERGFVFYTNYESRKGTEILANPNVALCFHWQPLERQVRVEGPAVPVKAAEADAYFASRARASQIGAWASSQSREQDHEGALAERVAEFERKFMGQDVPRPPYWSGFRVMPTRIEFWHAMPSRLHERRVYEREGDGWRVRTLYP
jgi:pyridoxamine 5'-phosphate oxidase